MIQYVTKFQIANASRTTSSMPVMALISAQTSEKSAALLLTYQTTAPSRTTDIPICRIWRDRLLPSAGDGSDAVGASSTAVMSFDWLRLPAPGARRQPPSAARNARFDACRFQCDPAPGGLQGEVVLPAVTIGRDRPQASQCPFAASVVAEIWPFRVECPDPTGGAGRRAGGTSCAGGCWRRS